MLLFTDSFPLALTGITFLVLGGAKVYGLRHGIVGGRDKPVVERLCGT